MPSSLQGKGMTYGGSIPPPLAIRKAQEKAAERGLHVHFLVLNTLELSKLNRKFDTATDSGLFDTLSDEDRPLFVDNLAVILSPAGNTSCSASATWNPSGTVRGG